MSWRDYLPHRWSLAERHCVLMCADRDIARVVIEQCAERCIALEWFRRPEDVELERDTFYIVFVSNREAPQWEDALRRHVYGRGASIINWF